MNKPIAFAILPESISARKRNELWETIAIGSLTFLTVDDVECFEENRWPIVKCEGISDERAAEELEIMRFVARRVYRRIKFETLD